MSPSASIDHGDHGDHGEGWAAGAPLPYWPPPQVAATPPAGPDQRPRRGRVLGVLVVVALAAGSAGGLAEHLVARPPSTAAATTGVGGTPIAPSSSLAVGAIVAKVEPSVVAVTAVLPGSRFSSAGTAAGTGIILSTDGEVVTNAHVVDGASTVRVTLSGESTARAATVLGVDAGADLALLRITGARDLPAAELGSSATAKVGDDVVAIGNALALGSSPTVTRGIVSALNRSLDESSGSMSGLLQTDASISSGNSGGPLVNGAGQVIGINSAVAASSRTTSAENIGFAIAIDRALPVIAQLRTGHPAAPNGPSS